MDCDARGEPSRLWLRRSVEGASSRAPGARLHPDQYVDHYVECMNCGAHLKGRADGRMEPVDEEEWRSFVDEEATRGGGLRPS